MIAFYIALVDSTGKVHHSDNITQDTIDNDSPYNTLEEGAEAVADVFKQFDSLDNVSMTINGRQRFFNPSHVMYFDVVRVG
jgi:hypothetical protein